VEAISAMVMLWSVSNPWYTTGRASRPPWFVRSWFVPSAVSILCAVVTVVCLLGVWGTFGEVRRIRRDVEQREALTAQLLAVVRDTLTLAARLGSVVERGCPVEQAEGACRGDGADGRPDRDPRRP